MRGHVHVEGTDEFKQTRNRICPKTSHRVSLVEARMSLIVSGRSRVGVCVWGGCPQQGASAEVNQLGPSAHCPAGGLSARLPEARCCSLVVRPETGPYFGLRKAGGAARAHPSSPPYPTSLSHLPLTSAPVSPGTGEGGAGTAPGACAAGLWDSNSC